MSKRIRSLVKREIDKIRYISETTEEPLDYKLAAALGNYSDIIIKVSKEIRNAEDFKKLHEMSPDELQELSSYVLKYSPHLQNKDEPKKGKK